MFKANKGSRAAHRCAKHHCSRHYRAAIGRRRVAKLVDALSCKPKRSPAPARFMVTSAQAAAAGGIADAISAKGALTVDQRGECEANRVTGGIAERRDNRVAADAKRTKAKSSRKVAATVEEQRCWHSALHCFASLT